MSINKFDGLIHGKNGKKFDPKTMNEVHDPNSESDDDEVTDTRGGLVQHKSEIHNF